MTRLARTRLVSSLPLCSWTDEETEPGLEEGKMCRRFSWNPGKSAELRQHGAVVVSVLAGLWMPSATNSPRL